MVAVAMSRGDGDRRWQKLAGLAQEEESPEKRFAILQELCVELAALEKQLIIAKREYSKDEEKPAVSLIVYAMPAISSVVRARRDEYGFSRTVLPITVALRPTTSRY